MLKLQEKYVLPVQILLSIFLLGLIYFQSISFGFLDWDDIMYIQQNEHIKNANFYELFKFDQYISLVLYSFSFPDFNHPHYFTIHRLLNIILHFFNSVLIFALLKKFIDNKFIISIICLIFLIHPTRVESVVWLMQRKDLLYTFFYLSSVLFYISYLTSKNIYRIIFLFLSLTAGFFSALSKIQALSLPLFLLGLDIYFKRKDYLIFILEKIVFFLLMLKSLWLEYNILFFFLLLLATYLFNQLNLQNYLSKQFIKKNKTMFLLALIPLLILLFNSFSLNLWDAPPSPELTNFKLIDRFFLASYSFIYYVFTFFIPFNLNPVKLMPQLHNNHLPINYYLSFIIILVALLLVLIFRLHKKLKNSELLALFYFLSSISIVLNFIDMRGYVIVANRYSYNASIGLLWFLGLVLSRINLPVKLSNLFQIFLILIMVSFVIYSYSYTKLWANSEKFWLYCLKKDENNFLAMHGLGNYYADKNPEKAIEYYTKAINRNNKSVRLYTSRARVYFDLKHYDLAQKDIDKALSLNPEFEEALFLNASLNYLNKNYEKANKDLDFVLKKSKNNSEAMLLKSLILLELKDTAQALQLLNQIPIDKRNSLYYELTTSIKNKVNLDDYYKNMNKAYNLFKQSNYDSALIILNKAIDNHPDLYNAYQNRGNIYAAKEEYKLAIDDYTKAIELNPAEASLYVNRGLIYLELNQKEQACKDFTKALELNHPRAEKLLLENCK